MVEQNQINTNMHLPSELIGKFRSKADFMKYMKEQCKFIITCL